MRKTYLAAAIAALPLLLVAATSAAADTVLAEVQVRDKSDEQAPAGRIPALSDSAALLEWTPGVSLYTAGGVSSLPAIHGMADDRLRIKVDGMDLISACSNHMNPPLSYIDPSAVASVKVFAGITPVSVGGDSIGGTIIVNSAAPEFAAVGQGTLFKGQAGTFYRSNGGATGVNLDMTAANEQLSVSYSGATNRSDNYKTAKAFKASGPAATGQGWLAGDEVGSTKYKTENHDLSFAVKNEGHLVELKLGVQHIPYQGFPNQRMDMTQNDSNRVNLRYTGQYQWGVLEARVYHENTRHQMNFLDDKQFWYPNSAPGMPMDTRGKNTGALVKADIVLNRRDILRVGGEYQRYRLDDWWSPSGTGGMSPNTFVNINNGERDRLAVFAEWEARWTPQWLTQFGLRTESVDMNAGAVQGYKDNATYLPIATAFNALNREKTDHNLDLTALARYTPEENYSLEFGYGRKTRSPSIYERYTWSTLSTMVLNMINWVGDGNGYVGNPNLKPEVAHTLSATARWNGGDKSAWNLSVTPYYTYVQNYIDAVACTSCATRTDGFSNLALANQSARIHGFNVSGFTPLGDVSGLGSLSINGLLNYTRGKNDDTGDHLYNIMPLNARLALVQQSGNWTSSIEAQMVEAKTRVSQIRKEIATSGYTLVNLRGSYQWQKIRLDVGVENLFNRSYNLPLGGAYVGQGATMSTGVPWGTSVPGMARSLYAGINVKF